MITVFADGAATNAAANAGAPGTGSMLFSLVMTFLPLVLIFYFMIVRPQKKQRKQLQNMLDALQVGDKIVTIGGIIGKVVKIKPEEVVIETGSGTEKSQVTFQKAAISSNLTIHE